MTKLRIAQVTNLQESVPPLNKNGLEQVVSYLTEELVKMGHNVTLFASADSKTSAKLVPLIPEAASRRPTNSLPQSLYYDVLSVSQAFSQSADFDVIHCHDRFVPINFSSLIPNPIITTIHHPVDLENERLEICGPAYTQKAAKIHSVVVSCFQQQKFKQPSDLVYNGLDLTNFTYRDQAQNYLAYLGYLTPDKGAAQAVQAVLPTNETLLIAGPIRDDDPAGQSYFKEKIEPFLNNRIKYLGPLSYDQKIKFLSGAKATLMPIQWDEPFGMVAIESLACGTPVIAWNRAAMPEIIEDGISGYLVNSVTEMTEKINQIAKIDRRSCRTRVEENFTAEKMAQKYVDLYTQILAR